MLGVINHAASGDPIPSEKNELIPPAKSNGRRRFGQMARLRIEHYDADIRRHFLECLEINQEDFSSWCSDKGHDLPKFWYGANRKASNEDPQVLSNKGKPNESAESGRTLPGSHSATSATDKFDPQTDARLDAPQGDTHRVEAGPGAGVEVESGDSASTNGPIEPLRPTPRYSEPRIRKWFKNTYVLMCLKEKFRPTEAEVLAAIRDEFKNKTIPRRVARELLRSDDTPKNLRRSRGHRRSGRDTPKSTK